MLRSVADARHFDHSAFATHCTELRGFAAEDFPTVEQDREISSPSGPGQIQRSLDQLCLMSGN